MPKETVTQQKEAALALDNLGDDRKDWQELLTDWNALEEKTKNQRTGWRNQVLQNYRWRRGDVGRPDNDLPFKGSSDIRYRRSEIYIRQIREALVSAVLSGDRVMRFTSKNPQGSESADRMEMFEDFVFRSEMATDRLRTIYSCADKAVEAGKCVVKTTWREDRETKTVVITREQAEEWVSNIQKYFQAQEMAAAPAALSLPGQPPAAPAPPPLPELKAGQLQEGIAMFLGWDLEDAVDKKRIKSLVEQYHSDAEVLSVTVEAFKYRGADIGFVEELQDIVVPTNTGRIAEAEWIHHNMIFSVRELRSMAVENGGKYKNVEDLLESVETAVRGRENREMDGARARTEGLTNTQEVDGYVNVREAYRWLERKYVSPSPDTANEDTMVRVVITYCPDHPQIKPLRKIAYPYDLNEWPFEDYNYGYTSDRYYSGEGIPALMNAHEREYNISKNAAINRNSVCLTPPMIQSHMAGLTLSQHRQFGDVMITKMPIDQSIKVLQYPDLATGFHIDAEGLNREAKELVGISDVTQQGKTPPTSEQIQMEVAPANRITTYDVRMWLDFWSRVYRKVFSLQKQYLFESGSMEAQEIQVPNLDNRKASFVSLKKEDFDQEYVIHSGGEVMGDSRTMQLQKTTMAFQMSMAYPAITPAVKPLDLYRILMIDLLGYERANMILHDAQEIPQFEEQFMQMQAQAKLAQEEGKGKKTPRIKEVPTASTGLIAK